MPKCIRWLDQAWEQLIELPDQLYKEALQTAAGLMVDPFPAGCVDYTPVPGTCQLDTHQVTLFYRIIELSNEIDIVRVQPNT